MHVKTHGVLLLKRPLYREKMAVNNWEKMEVVSENIFKKWNIIKEQLILLCALNLNAKSFGDLEIILNEDASLESINSQIVITICYFLLGIIDSETRDKLIKWPIINIQTNAKFRKGLSTMVLSFQERYPWAHIKKLPESYLVNPHANQKKVVDFISRLNNLAIHLVLNDSELLVMHSGNGLTNQEIEIMTDIIMKAVQNEEKLINHNVLPAEEFQYIKKEISDKCIALKKESIRLEHSISCLFKCAIKDNIIESEKDGVEGLKSAKEEKLSQLAKINYKLANYQKVGKELILKLKALKNPVCLTAKDFNISPNSWTTLTQETLRVCEELQRLFQYITSFSDTRGDELKFLENLILARDVLEKENNTLKSYMSEVTYPKP